MIEPINYYAAEDTPAISRGQSPTLPEQHHGQQSGQHHHLHHHHPHQHPVVVGLEQSKGLASGLETPASEAAGPQLYATEGTPGQLSRSDSFDDGEDDEDRGCSSSDETGEEKGQLEAAEGPSEKDLKTSTISSDGSTDVLKQQQQQELQNAQHPQLQPPASAVKSVSFQPQQTPLMYSRSSTPESLNSFVNAAASIRSGYSSCDFSRVNNISFHLFLLVFYSKCTDAKKLPRISSSDLA